MPDIYPLRNDHKQKFLDLESRINARRANLYKLSFREQLDAPNAFFYSRSSKGRLVSLSVMADDVSRSRDPSFKHLSSPINFNSIFYVQRSRHALLFQYQSNWPQALRSRKISVVWIYLQHASRTIGTQLSPLYIFTAAPLRCSRLPFTTIIRSNTHLS